MDSEESLLPSSSCQRTVMAAAAVFACHQLRAMTATPAPAPA
jgi:hypothetical protein